MDYLETNFADLEQQYLRRDETSEALALLRRSRSPGKGIDLTWLLRHHDEGDVTDPETRKRDSFDHLLAAYGLLEIASIIRFVPGDVPIAFREEALGQLSHPAVKKYYETNYPLLLPSLYRKRLAGEASEDQPGDQTQLHGLFSRFLGLVNRLDADEEVETFLWFVDSGSIGSANLGTTKRLLRNHDRTMKVLLKRAEDRTAAEDSVCGAESFLRFCAELDALLAEAEDFPVFQAAMWNFYAYWFRLIGRDLGDALVGILDTLAGWVSEVSEPHEMPDRSRREDLVSQFWRSVEPDTTSAAVHRRYSDLLRTLDESGGGVDARAIRAYVSPVKGAVERLLSGEYGRALRPG